MRKTLIAMFLSLLLILNLALPAFAVPLIVPRFGEDEIFRAPATGSLSHSAGYQLEGMIDFRKQAGHYCNTGAEMLQTIKGDGLISKEMTVLMVGGKINLDDSNDFVAAADSMQGLEVTSVIRLCAPPKSIFTEKGAFYSSLVAFFNQLFYNYNIPGVDQDDEQNARIIAKLLQEFPQYQEGQAVPPLWHYLDQLPPGSFDQAMLDLMAILGLSFLGNFGGAELQTELEELLKDYFDLDSVQGDEALQLILSRISSLQEIDPLTDQIWAVSVAADPGHTGSLNQQFSAASGPWGGVYSPLGDLLSGNSSDVPQEEIDQLNIYFFGDGQDDTFWFDFTEYPDYTVERGPDFVGSYFTIDQYAYTDQGTMKRYIDISSSWNHGYLSEDMTVTGQSSVEETFSMLNLEAGVDMPANWWVLF